MKWVYIIKCEDDHYYVGTTSRLFKRFREHENGIGGRNTSVYVPEQIVAIYKVDILCKFIEYNWYVNNIIDHSYDKYEGHKLRLFNHTQYENMVFCDLDAENFIAECLMIHNQQGDRWKRIRGGKYTRFDVQYKFPDHNNYVKELPLCNCGLPCDMKKNDDDNYIYFRCAKKNMWDKFKEDFNIDENPCKFYKEYVKDKELKIEYENKMKEHRDILKQLFRHSFWLENVEANDENYPNQCVGNCHRTSKSIKLTYKNIRRNLCYDCFINKNEDLSKKYTKAKKCLFVETDDEE